MLGSASLLLVPVRSSGPPQEKVDAWEEERRVSKYADGLEQLPATKRIPMDPKQVGWVRIVY